MNTTEGTKGTNEGTDQMTTQTIFNPSAADGLCVHCRRPGIDHKYVGPSPVYCPEKPAMYDADFVHGEVPA
jgi:hypothetical protein